ncbi:unnamed protein product [Miscanthus lutarioriparius]|uniref:Uncharacterized protein n=1 Tax=Miscanthus lutarioriparius TaxID=422564 RepID=A0A811N4F0_9POAL|nr:unnamed protein product [Miscanthus lutarioriparius]
MPGPCLWLHRLRRRLVLVGLGGRLRRPLHQGLPRLADAVNAVRKNAPRVAGRFGAYCVFFSVIENAASLALRRDDHLTGGTAAAATGGLHGMLRRGGDPAAARCALLAATGFLGLDLALDWALRVIANRLYPQKRQMNPGQAAPAVRLPSPWVDASQRRPPQWLKMSPSGTREKGAASLF